MFATVTLLCIHLVFGPNFFDPHPSRRNLNSNLDLS